MFNEERTKEFIKYLTALLPWRLQTSIYRVRRNKGLVGALYLKIADQTHNRVLRGPFAGMEIETGFYGPTGICRILGSYEYELRHWIRKIVKLQPKRIVIVGAAEGYYAIGFASLLPNARIITFEKEKAGRLINRQLAIRNGVKDRIAIRGFCDPNRLERVLRPGTVVFCDVEGYETTLLDPAKVPTLRSCHILAELHDVNDETAMFDTITRRFAETHLLQVVPAEPRIMNDWPEMLELPEDLARIYLDEGRLMPGGGPQTATHRWIALEPRTMVQRQAASNGAIAS